MINLQRGCDWPWGRIEGFLGLSLNPGQLVAGVDAARIDQATALGHRRVTIGLAPSEGNVLVAALVGSKFGVAYFGRVGTSLETAADDLTASTERKLTVALVRRGRVRDVVEPPCDPLFWEVLAALLRGESDGVSAAGKRWSFRRMGVACLTDGSFGTI